MVKDFDVYTVNLLSDKKIEAEVDIYTTEASDVGSFERKIGSACQTHGVKWNYKFGEQDAKGGGHEYRLEVKIQGKEDPVVEATACLKSVVQP